jgi:hypothetical protein
MENKLRILLQDAISNLHEEKIEEAISLLSKARKEVIKQISSEAITPEMYNLLLNLSTLTYLGMLHYLAVGHRTTKEVDSIAKLACLSESLGISNIIDGVFLPLLMIDDSMARQKFLPLLRQCESCREDLSKEVGQLVNTFRNCRGREQEQYNDSIKTVIKAVNPGSEQVRALALQLGRRFEAGNFKQARRIYEYVRDEIHYMPDPLPFEDIQPPETTLKRLSGDCDDKAILLCSLLLAIGFETALFFADTDGDGMADHVYSSVHIPSAPDLYKPFMNKKIAGKDLRDWIPLDPTSEDLDFGVITFDDLEIKHAFFFTREGQHFVDKEEQ